jgi:hypothetical protein
MMAFRPLFAGAPPGSCFNSCSSLVFVSYLFYVSGFKSILKTKNKTKTIFVNFFWDQVDCGILLNAVVVELGIVLHDFSLAHELLGVNQDRSILLEDHLLDLLRGVAGSHLEHGFPAVNDDAFELLHHLDGELKLVRFNLFVVSKLNYLF